MLKSLALLAGYPFAVLFLIRRSAAWGQYPTALGKGRFHLNEVCGVAIHDTNHKQRGVDKDFNFNYAGLNHHVYPYV